jgi:TolB-like protein
MDNIFKIYIFCIVVLFFTGCTTIGAKNRVISLDNAIQLAVEKMEQDLGSTYLNDAVSRAASAEQDMRSGNMGIDSARQRVQLLNKKPVIAVLNFSSNSNKLSAYVLEELTLRLADSDRFTVVERQRLEVIRRERNFQLSGEVSDATIQSIGNQLGAQYVITGSLIDLKDIYRFRVYALGVETAAITAPTTVDVDYKDKRITRLTAPENGSPPNGLSEYSESANRDSIEYGTNHYMEWNENYKGFYWEPISIHWSLIPFTSIGLGAGFGFGNTGNGQAITKGGVTPYAGLVIPITENVRLFGDGFMEVGYNNIGSFFNGSGLSLNPGFDAGILFSFENGFGFNLRYKGIWTGDGGYINSLGITMSENATKKKFDTDAIRIWFLSELSFLFTGIVGVSYLSNSGVPNTAAGVAAAVGGGGAFVCLIGGICTLILRL